MAKPDIWQSRSRIEIGSLIKRAFEVVTSAPDECIELARKALELSNKSRDRLGLGHAFMHIGLGYYHKGDLAVALDYYKQAEEVFLTDRELYGLRSVYNNIGVVYHNWRDRDKALHYYQLNLDLEAELPNPRLNSSIMNNIATIHTWSNDFDLAREFVHKSLAYAKQANYPYGEALALNSLAHICIRENKLDDAEKLLEQSLELRNTIGDVSGMITCFEHLAGIHVQRGEHAKARKLLDLAMEKAVQMDSKQEISYLSLQLGELAKQDGDIILQKSYLKKCIELASANQYRDHEINALRELALVYEHEKRYKLALETYWRYQDQKNYVIDQDRNRNIQQLRMQMEVAEKEREMKLVRETNLRLEKKNRQISRQKSKLEKAETKLLELNRTLEQRVEEEVGKRRQQEQLVIQKSKLESLGRLSAGIAHEINQPLGMISLGIQNLLEQLDNGAPDKAYIAKKTAYFEENIDRIRRIIEHVRLFSREQQDDSSEKTDLIEIVQNALSMITLQCKNHNINISFDHPSQPVHIIANKYRVEQVVLNLLSNARDALEERFDQFNDQKRITISISLKAKWINLEIRDNGAGIKEDVVPHIFDPFFTTKSETKGTGLGLSICYGIINDLGGGIFCESSPSEGTTMRVELPNLFGGNPQ